MKTSEVQLVSSDGWNSVTFFMSENPIPNQDGLIQVALVSKGIFWNRRQILSISPTYESMDEFDITLHQVILSKERLVMLIQRLEKWLDVREEFDLDISGAVEQKVSFGVGTQDKIIYRIDKPVFTMTYETSRIITTFRFVIDQSCISSFIGQMAAWIVAANNT